MTTNCIEITLTKEFLTIKLNASNNNCTDEKSIFLNYHFE